MFVGVPQYRQYAHVLLDLVKAFERVPYRELLRGALRPARIPVVVHLGTPNAQPSPPLATLAPPCAIVKSNECLHLAVS